MMGSGKTSMGEKLAQSLGTYSFIDTDTVIEQVIGGQTTISEYFDQAGEEAFRDVESQVSVWHGLTAT